MLVGLSTHTSCVGRIEPFPSPTRPSTLDFPHRSPTPPTPLPAEGAPAGPMMKEEGLRSRRRFSTCGGTASLRPPHPDGRKLIRNASFGGYNELSPISLPGGCTTVWRSLGIAAVPFVVLPTASRGSSHFRRDNDV